VTVDVDRFTRVLAQRLAAIVPAGIHVEAGDGMLRYSADDHAGPSGTHMRDNFGVYGETDEDNLVGLAVQALDELQDYVSEATRDPWPGATRQPRPRAEIRDGALYAWYGDDGATVLGCAPIPLADLAGR
jgi:hypothetical protein